MSRRFTLLLSFVVVAGCKKDRPKVEPHEDARPMRVFVFDASAAAAASAALVKPDAGAIEDFEDEFGYGHVDAGTVDPKRLASPAYEPYANARFHFGLDVPTSFNALDEPDNGDGMVWRFGNSGVIAASGRYAIDDAPPTCPNSKNVTAHRTGKNTCWSTGKKDGFIFWYHVIRKGDVEQSLRFEYAESLKDAMDPIVNHVSASWNP